MIINQTLLVNLKTDDNVTDKLDIFSSGGNSSESNLTTAFYTSEDNTSVGALGDYVPWNQRPGFDLLKLVFILSRSFTVVFSFTGILFNTLLFAATRKITPRALKSKSFIQNAIIADIVMCSGHVMILAGITVEGFGVSPFVYKSVTSFARHLNTGSLYGQAFASLLLAGDRMYAVLKPMTYHTLGYSTIAKGSLIATSWTAAIGLMSVGIIIPFTMDRYENKPFHIKLSQGFPVFSDTAKPTVAIGVNITIFVLYIVIFIAFALQRRMNRAVVESTTEKAGTALSLTLTYFFIHVSSLCLYLGGPIMKLLGDKEILPSTSTYRLGWVAISQTLVTLYVCNAMINPLILVSRVRLIREKLFQTLRPQK